MVAETMNSLVNNYLDDFANHRPRRDRELSQFLWDNKTGLLRAVEMLKLLRENDGECIGDHPDWLQKMDAILSGLGEK